MPLIGIRDRVKQACTGSGQGPLTLGTPLTGFIGLENVCANNDLFSYEVHSVDANGAPSGQWEVGIGQMVTGAPNTIKRVLCLDGSDAGFDFVDFTAGVKHIALTVPAAQAAGLRLVSGDRSAYGSPPTFYVRAGGNNNHSGLIDDDANAFANLYGAVDVASKLCSRARIMVGPGDFSAAEVWAGAQSGPNLKLEIVGDSATTTFLPKINAGMNTYLYIHDASVAGLNAWGSGAYIYAETLAFAAAAGDHHMEALYGGLIEVWGYAVAGGASGAHLHAGPGGMIISAGDVDLVADVAFPAGWAACIKGMGHIDAGDAVIALNGHSVTGPRYDMRGNGVLYTNGGGATFLPGSSAGVTSAGGQAL